MTREDLIEKYVSAHAECRWMDAGDLDDLLHSFVRELDLLKLPEGLEEASHTSSEEFVYNSATPFPNSEYIAHRIGFKTGAKWQAEKDKEIIELAEDHAMLAGMNKMKEQMMEKAVEGEVIGYDDGTGKFITVLEDLPDDSPYKVHDKVKLIVIPEENLNAIQNEN